MHGLGGSATNWTDLADQLSGHAPGTALDLPGFGRSAPPDGYDFTLESHVRTLVSVLGGFDGPVHLLGNSMGGAICLLAAAEAPSWCARSPWSRPPCPTCGRTRAGCPTRGWCSPRCRWSADARAGSSPPWTRPSAPGGCWSCASPTPARSPSSASPRPRPSTPSAPGWRGPAPRSWPARSR
ncbi:alpha/beta fold hydrolase [Actinokineospora soli]|uniref:Alpha/beta fold hydrolase n=1 Tax=Actinokineospora soli TaxID=1048753 RepID=A0ABW2TJW4_9PSEU